jgi:transposase
MSSPPLRVFLSGEQDRTLWELRKAVGVPQRTKDRAQALRLSGMGWKVEKIATYLKWSPSTVRSTLHRWQLMGLAGLWDAPRPGRRRKWLPENMAVISEKLETEQRTYSSRQLCQVLATSSQVHLSERQLRRILKKKLLMEKNKKLDERKAKS